MTILAHDSSLKKIITHLRKGGIIAYPTEAVYGIGCDPFKEKSVLRLLSLKQREIEKGLLLIASHWSQLEILVEPIATSQLEVVKSTWPGPTTWVFPATKQVPFWISGKHRTIAVRITNHPLVRSLCDGFQGPIISTSANPAGQAPAKTAEQVRNYFNDKIKFILEGDVGGLESPTPIRDAITGQFFRE